MLALTLTLAESKFDRQTTNRITLNSLLFCFVQFKQFNESLQNEWTESIEKRLQALFGTETLHKPPRTK